MKPLASFVLLASLSLGLVVRDGSPVTVQVVLTAGRVFKGEVLAIRDSTVVFGTKPALGPGEMVGTPGSVLVVPFTQVRMVATEGSSNAATGGLIGAPIGCLGGAAIASANSVERQSDDIFGCFAMTEQSSNVVGGMAIGLLAGAAIGCAAGSASGDKGQELITDQQRDFSFLKAVARYPDIEPTSLQKIGR